MLNALENVRSSIDVAERGRTMARVADMHELARLSLAETVDALEVLSQGAFERQREPGLRSARVRLQAAGVALEAAQRLGVRWAVDDLLGVALWRMRRTRSFRNENREGGASAKVWACARRTMRQLVAVLLFVLPLTSITFAQVNPLPKLPPKPYPPAPRLVNGEPNLGPTEPNKGYAPRGTSSSPRGREERLGGSSPNAADATRRATSSQASAFP